VNSLPGFAAWLTALLPANPIKAATDGAMLPLIAFILFLGMAAGRIEPALRASLMGFFSAVAVAMTTVVGWIIAAAPIGIFALVAGAASRMGIGLAGAMAYYVIAISAVLALFALLLYPVAATLGGIRLPAFTRAVLPPQIVAMGSSSSLASLPALIAAGRELTLPSAVTGFVLPLAVSSFKVATPITWGIGALFLSKLYGVPLSSGSFVTLMLTAIALSLSIPGVPQGAQLLLAPVVASFGIPAEGVALLIAADTIPDLVGTMTNVTGDLAVATIAAHVAGDDTEQMVSLAATGVADPSSVS
jgi:proton glutamate symport protein